MYKIAALIDPIETLKIHSDTTLALLHAAQRLGAEIYYLLAKDLYVRDGKVYGMAIAMKMDVDNCEKFQLSHSEIVPLSVFNIILMRKNPPFDIDYIHVTHLLDLAMKEGVLVVNNPQSLRDGNEKLMTTWFPYSTPPTLISCDIAQLKNFHQEYEDVVFKPLSSYGGQFVFRVKPNDSNVQVILQFLTQDGQRYIVAQRFIPEITAGDKRIHLVNGIVFPYGLRRIPHPQDWRGNLFAGATAEPFKLNEAEMELAYQIAPILKQKGVVFAGIDVIGNYVTEINITSPTCVREVDNYFGTHLAGEIMQAIIEEYESGSALTGCLKKKMI